MNIKNICWVLIFVFSINVSVIAGDEGVEVSAEGAVLMDYKTGRVLFGKNIEKPLAMASTTKIMTAIIALENSDVEDIVTVSKKATKAPPVKMYLKDGEKIQLKYLLYALMLQSSNDAAVAIAEYVGGDTENFCKIMTQKAKEIGCKDTIFETPNGLDKGEHHSTAYDMALIARYALNNKQFREIIKTPNITFKSDKCTYNAVNKNKLLNEYEGALGIKTGFTGKAGHCFVGAAEKGGVVLISVVLASGWGTKGKTQKWKDTKEILDYGFENYRFYPIINKNDFLGEINVKNSEIKNIELCFEKDFETILTENEYKNIKIEKTIPNNVNAPIKKGQIIGYAEIYLESEMLGKINIISKDYAEEKVFLKYFFDIITKWANFE